MTLRRSLLAAGLAVAMLPGATFAVESDAADVEKAVDALTQAMLTPDKATLASLTHDALSYGHSNGNVQDKATFIDALISGRSAFASIQLSKRTAVIVGEDAIARHVFDAETKADGKTTPVHIGILQVWRREGGSWKLLARQAVKL